MRRRGHPLLRHLHITMVGQAKSANRRCVTESGAADLVTSTGYVSHQTALGWLGRADVLFLPMHGQPPGTRSLTVPGKTYEYLAAGKPILACVPAGDARDLIEASGFGYCADPCDESAIARQLDLLYEHWHAGILPTRPPTAWIKRYERRAIAGRVAEFVERCAAYADAAGTRAE
jgi:glycosyltransferase involved in cell wall biosynthesis